ncbi:hypothetical protein Tco_0616579, partial [Tanacetum coccineum]
RRYSLKGLPTASIYIRSRAYQLVNNTRPIASTPNEPKLHKELVFISGPRRQDTMGDTIARTRFENVSKTSNDSTTLRRDYKPEKESQEARTKRKVKNFTWLKRLYKVGTSRRVESSAEASLWGRFDDEDMFDTSVFNDEEVFAGQDMADQEVNVVKIRKLVIVCSRDKGKAKMVKEKEPKKLTKRKDQIKHDKELAKRLEAQLQAEMEEEDRLARQREEEDNIVSYDNA